MSNLVENPGCWFSHANALLRNVAGYMKIFVAGDNQIALIVIFVSLLEIISTE